MSIKASRFYGIGLALLTVGTFAACSSSSGDDTGNTGTGGTSSAHAGTTSLAGTTTTTGGTGISTGGTGTGTAGTGTAGTGTGTAGTGTGGSGGGTAGGGFACAGKKPAAPLITEFADLAPNATSAGQFTFTLGTPGGTFAYQPAALTVTDSAKSLEIKGKVMNYDGFGVYFTDCTDASAYDGVSFTIKGNAGTTGMLNFRFQTNADMPITATAKKGACVVPAGTADSYPICHPPTLDIPVSADGATVEVKFAQVMGGIPVATVDGKDVVGLEWAFAWAGATDTPYDADITLDDIHFTGGSAGGTGSGGAGGTGGGGSGGTAGGGTGGSQ